MLLPLPLLEIKPAILEGRAINSKSLAVTMEAHGGRLIIQRNNNPHRREQIVNVNVNGNGRDVVMV